MSVEWVNSGGEIFNPWLCCYQTIKLKQWDCNHCHGCWASSPTTMMQCYLHFLVLYSAIFLSPLHAYVFVLYLLLNWAGVQHHSHHHNIFHFQHTFEIKIAHFGKHTKGSWLLIDFPKEIPLKQFCKKSASCFMRQWTYLMFSEENLSVTESDFNVAWLLLKFVLTIYFNLYCTLINLVQDIVPYGISFHI